MSAPTARGDEAAAPNARSVSADYLGRAEAHAALRDAAAREARRISWMRLLVFVAGVAAGWWLGVERRLPPIIAGALVAAAAIAFVALVIAHRRARVRERWHEARRAACAIGDRRVRRDWSTLPVPAVPPVATSHPYANDIDVVGRASLLQLLDVASTAPGRPTMLRWLLEPTAPLGDVHLRQAAAAELKDRVEWRETLTAHAALAGDVGETELTRFLAWAEGTPWLRPSPLLLWLSRLLLVVTLASIAGWRLGMVPGSVIAIPIVANLVLLGALRDATRRTIDGAALGSQGLAAHAAMLRHIATSDLAAPLLASIRQRITSGGIANEELARLGRIVAWSEVRFSPMLHVLLQSVLLWDLQIVAQLERWQRTAGARARDWLDALGECEALSALATLAHDNPGWVFPEMEAMEQPLLAASRLGHPLIAEERRVTNDVAVGPPRTFLLVTGSNMSGKSTLLRAIGTNVVLAHAGGPVCAQRLRLPPLYLRTSIRIQDSLEEGVSLFMAELLRLKAIVEAAKCADVARPVVYLLDEILHGTNTAERRIAARTILQHLLGATAIGAVTTHDLSLAEDQALAPAAVPVHFTEAFERRDGVPVMTFDYALRPGLATSVNALKLLEILGLGAGGRGPRGERTAKD